MSQPRFVNMKAQKNIKQNKAQSYQSSIKINHAYMKESAILEKRD